ncbi:MAG: Crp/Fnr family transcriptional regulator [Methylococcales bacterium]|nr:Crp/Fnr family transcriptional regulator [Methylococcales bacterium]MDP3010342.1 Crp/Fnr family transcriptional regulator [Methylococcales bacterium]
MLPTLESHSTNLLLAALPQKDRDALLSDCEQVELVFAEELYRAGDIIPHVYFPIKGFISLIMPVDDDANLEVGLSGNEGMLGITLILNIDVAPFHSLVQGAGSAFRISTALFRHHLARSPALQKLLTRYLYVTIMQLALTGACTRFHLVEARLARWLLMTQDRAHSSHFHITHVFLAYMLGVRRVGITKAATSLQKRNLISYRRGNITILDRAGLEAASCSCYQVNKETYQESLGRTAEDELLLPVTVE